MRRVGIAALLLAPIALAACGGKPAENKADAVDTVEVQPEVAAGAGAEVVTVDAGPTASVTGVTPMGERVAVLGLLNKRNGAARELTLKPGQAMRVGDVIVRLRACERTAPWETDQLTGAFAQVDIRGTDGKFTRAFSGWLYKERPALNLVQHPIYDVWVKSCAMTFPDTGGEVVGGGASEDAGRSSAPKSAETDAAPPAAAASPAAPSPSESDSNDR
jgi:hypothetical protein